MKLSFNSILTSFLVIITILFARLAHHETAMIPLMAMGFAASYFLGWRGVAAMILANIAADSMLGFYSPLAMLGTYAGHASSGLIGLWARSKSNVWAGLATTPVFFLLSNLGVWGEGYYGYTGQGLISCYMAAIPFLRNQMTADMVALTILATGVSWIAYRKPSSALV